jgi:hypothetical protein
MERQLISIFTLGSINLKLEGNILIIKGYNKEKPKLINVSVIRII